MKQNNSKSRVGIPISKVGFMDNSGPAKAPLELRIDGIKERTAYSGGFKMPDRNAHGVVMQQPIKDAPPNRQDILKHLGVTDEQPYDQRTAGLMPQSKSDLQDKLVDSIEAKLDRIRFERAKLLDSGLKQLKDDLPPARPSTIDSNVLKIHESKERKQTAYQQPSSLEAMTIENLEAQLEAHRISLKPLEEKFFQKRGRSPPSNPLTVGQQVQAEKKQLIYAVKKPEEKEQEARKRAGIDDDELERLFEEKKKTDPKLAEYDAKFKQYEVQKLARKAINKSVRQTLFRPDWDKYKQEAEKSRSKERISSKSKDKAKVQVRTLDAEFESTFAKENISNNTPPKESKVVDRLDYLEQKYSLEKIVLSKNDQYITKYIFKILDPNHHGVISKEELFEYCMGQEVIRKDFGIDEKWFYSDLDTFPTKRKGILAQDECLEFLSVQRMLQHPEIELVDPNQLRKEKKKNLKSGLQLTDEQLKLFEEIFKSLDPHEDKLVRREDLIDSLYMDPEVIAILDSPAIHVDLVGKSVSLRQILELLLSEYRIEKNPKNKKAKEYITLNQFMDFFRRWEGLQLSILDRQSKPRTAESEVFDIYPDYLQLLLDMFNTIPRIYQDYICTKDFLELCRMDPQIQSIEQELCRIDSIETGLKLQNVGLVLKRMHIETDEYACWHQLKQYFSRRGRPVDWDLNEINLRKELRQKRIAAAELKLSATQSRLKKKFNTQKSFGLEVNKQTLKEAAASVHPGGRYTVPNPFPITDILKPKNAEPNEEGKKTFEELREGIKALPLNKQILEPKMEKLEKQRAQRSKQIKEQSKKRTAETEKPFSFYEKEMIAKILKEAAAKDLLNKKVEEQQSHAVRATGISIDSLKKPYKEVLKEGEEKRKVKKPTTEFQVSDSLYPKNPTQIQRDKAKKVSEKIEKLDQIDARRKQEIERVKKSKEEENKKKQDVLKQKKRREQQQQREKDIITKKVAGATFKPEVNDNFQPDPNREDTKKKRQEKDSERIQQFMREQQEKRRKILEFQPKQQPKIDINELDDEEILEKLSDIDFEDIIDEEQLKAEFKRMKEFEAIPFSNRKKLNRDRRNAMMGRERKEMEAEQRRRRQEIIERTNQERKQREQSREKVATGQLQRTKDKKIDVKANTFEGGFAIHKSKALRRYRDLMDGKTPLSEYDRLSNQPTIQQQDFDREAEQFSHESNSTIKEQ